MEEIVQLSLSDPDGLRKSLKELTSRLRRERNAESPQRKASDALAAQLNDAIARGDREIFAALAKPTKPRKSGESEPSLLPWAAMEGHAEIVNALLEAGADPDEAVYKMPVVAVASSRGHVEVVKQLIAAGASLAVTGVGDPLTYAIEPDNEEVVALLLAAGADVNAKSMAGSPLYQAIKLGNLSLIERLIAAGADVQLSWIGGNNLLAVAINKASESDSPSGSPVSQIIRTLVKHGIDVNAVNMHGRTPLMLAAETGHEAAVATLLECGADVNIVAHSPDPAKERNPFFAVDRATALILAARAGHTEIVSQLLSAGADTEIADNSNLTALQWAKRNGHSEVVERLLAAGAKADEASPQALLAASREGDLATVRKSIEAGVEVNIHDEAGSLNEEIIGPSPLILAAAAGHVEVVAELLQAGADVELQSKAFPASINPLMAAAEQGHVEVMEQLLAAGADVNAKNKGFEGGRMQSLHFAAQKGHALAAKLLIDRGAKIDAKDADKQTPLHYAAMSGDMETVKLLLDAGADPHAKDGHGGTPRAGLKYAEKNNPKIGALLQEAERSKQEKPPKAKKKRTAPAIPNAWENAPWEIDRPDFTHAAARAEFAQAIDYAAKHLDAQPYDQDDLPGVKLFKTTRGKALELVNSNNDAIDILGAMAVFGLGRYAFGEEDPDIVMLLPTTRWEETVAYIQTADPNGNKGPGQIVAGLQQLYELRSFRINQVAHDTIGGNFTAPSKNSRAMAKWMYEFCSDIVDQGVGSVGELARQLKESDRLFFWWD